MLGYSLEFAVRDSDDRRLSIRCGTCCRAGGMAEANLLSLRANRNIYDTNFWRLP